jgi:hypothetical protein
VTEQDVILGKIPLPNGPCVISEPYRDALLQIRHIIEERLFSDNQRIAVRERQ